MTENALQDVETEKRDKVRKLLGAIYYEWSKPITPNLIAYWRKQLSGMNIEFAFAVAKELTRRKTYGEPKFQDFWNLAREMSRREKIEEPYSPWTLPGPARFKLLDMPGEITIDSAGEYTRTLEQPREGRREITVFERKLLEHLNKEC